jgi:hypothetical protein
MEHSKFNNYDSQPGYGSFKFDIEDNVSLSQSTQTQQSEHLPSKEIGEQEVKSLIGVETYKNDENKVISYIEIKTGYQLTKLITHSQNYSFSDKEQYRKVYAALAATYKKAAEKIASEKSFFSFLENLTLNQRFFTDLTQEYSEALCVANLTMASEMGCAQSSKDLFNIYKEDEYYLPTDVIDKNAEALKYANRAKEQGGTTEGSSPVKLSLIHEQNKFGRNNVPTLKINTGNSDLVRIDSTDKQPDKRNDNNTPYSDPYAYLSSHAYKLDGI